MIPEMFFCILSHGGIIAANSLYVCEKICVCLCAFMGINVYM